MKALLELVGEGMLEPTAEQVAERANVGTRGVYRHFNDMDRLFAAMDASIQASVRPSIEAPPLKGTPAERAAAFVERRATLYKTIAPYRRAANIKRQHSKFLQNKRSEVAGLLSLDIYRWLPEFQKADRAQFDAFEVATSFETWDRLRLIQKHDQDRAVVTMLALADALIEKL